MKDGDILEAARTVVQLLIEGKKSHSDILYVWDQIRGKDDFENYVRKDTMIEILRAGV